MAWTETAVPPSPWVSTAGGTPVWTPSPPCGTTVNVTVQQKTQTLYYIAAQGQTAFPMSTADMFGNNVLLDGSQALTVSKGGLRLVPDDGTGAGGYTVDLTNNLINLLWPAGSGEILVVDIYDDTAIGTGPQGPQGPMGPQGPAGVVGSVSILQDVLTVTATNVVSVLSLIPDGRVFVLFVEGRPFFAVGPNPAFRYSGTTITWVSTLYSLQPGNEVVAVYTSASQPPPANWWTFLPTTLPPLPGVLWNNGGVICVS